MYEVMTLDELATLWHRIERLETHVRELEGEQPTPKLELERVSAIALNAEGIVDLQDRIQELEALVQRQLTNQL